MRALTAVAEYDDIDGIPQPAQNPEFIGHSDVIDFLNQMRTEKRLHHALLFEGPQGVGKATLAFQFAYGIFSGNSIGLEKPDVNSQIWRQIAQGTHPGLLHITRPFDSKTQKFRSAITVEEIRQITHFLQQTASDRGWRIVIIDPADDMNRNAANALLKTLEEPPAKALFILVSHHSGRLLPTIRSRCQPIVFKTLGGDEMCQALSLIAGPIGFDAQAPEETAALIKGAQGSVRKAALMLAYGGLEITGMVDKILSQPYWDVSEAYKLATALSARDATVQYSFFTDYVLNLIGNAARHIAVTESAGRANALATFWQALESDMAEAEAYNLDKKQYIIVLLQKIHALLAPEMAK